jgi:hypothetical protein
VKLEEQTEAAGRSKENSMRTRIFIGVLLVGATFAFSAENVAPAPERAPNAQVEPVTKGLRVFTCGHSFHAPFLPGWLSDIAKTAGIKEHEIVGVSMIGGSRVIQHWNMPDEKNKAKGALRDGKVDVLTLSPMHQPDDGIDKFAKLALEHNADIRVTIQEFQLNPKDVSSKLFEAKFPK